jgi:hypothetical protein
LADWIAPIRDLSDGVAFEVFWEIRFAHIALIASKITYQAFIYSVIIQDENATADKNGDYPLIFGVDRLE